MHILKIITLSFFLLKSTMMFSQQIDEDTYKKKKTLKSFLKKNITPASFIVGGILLSGSGLENAIQNDVGGTVNTSFDDYTRFAPVGGMYVADALGVESKNHWFDQTKNLAISAITTSIITSFLKSSISKQRPGTSENFNSFPSAHTSMAFSTGSVFYEEFKDSSPALAYTGYAFAGVTGGLRVGNNAHYISDVLVGAGIAILVTKAVYHFQPLKKWNPFKKLKNIQVIPSINEENRPIAHIRIKF